MCHRIKVAANKDQVHIPGMDFPQNLHLPFIKFTSVTKNAFLRITTLPH